MHSSADARTRPALPRRSSGSWWARDAAVMGTAIHAECWSSDPRIARDALDAVIDEMHRIDACYSPHKKNSELSRINRDAGECAVDISEETALLVERALRFSQLSGGAFDITYAGVGHLYDYRAGIVPDDAEVAAARANVGWQGVLLDRRTGTLRFARPGMRIDLGGFAKGHAVERGAALLRAHGIVHGRVSAGGDTRLLGDRGGRPWSIAVRHPRDPGGVVAVLPLADCAISTSGDYERYCLRDGTRHHHLIDPATGRSPQQLQSVTVVADDGLTSEALSKTVFVLGVARGLAIVESVPGADAVVVDAEGRLHVSAGLERAAPGRTAA